MTPSFAGLKLCSRSEREHRLADIEGPAQAGLSIGALDAAEQKFMGAIEQHLKAFFLDADCSAAQIREVRGQIESLISDATYRRRVEIEEGDWR